MRKKIKNQVLVISTVFVTARGNECVSCWEGYRCMCPLVLLEKVGYKQIRAKGSGRGAFGMNLIMTMFEKFVRAAFRGEICEVCMRYNQYNIDCGSLLQICYGMQEIY